MSLPDSGVRVVDGKAVLANPFRSRSTILCLACLATLMGIVVVSMKSGFYNVEFASMCLLVLREMIAAALNHQFRADQNGSSKPS